jgi:hypothetical protein
LSYARAEGHFDRTLQVSGAVSLDVTTGSGDISIKTGSSSQVVVRGTIHTNNWLFSNENAVHQVESNPPIQQSGKTLENLVPATTTTFGELHAISQESRSARPACCAPRTSFATSITTSPPPV